MNPPYSARWDNDKSRIKDPRFKEYGKLAPASKADYAFLLHGLYHLKPSGRMAILLPHGVLFRTGTEETIRKTLLERNYIDAVIGLPANLFHSTGIPTCVLVLRKDKKDHDVLFIDASQHFEKAKKQNRLREEDVELILDTYANRTDVDKLAHVATYQEIQDNESNLNIPRYVDTFEPEERIDLDQVNEELAETDKQIAELEAKFNALAADLVETRATED
ncbi:MAG: N-6 DNA methylase [Aeriscardovia sp.]|nr:N-6 DNA methylase [Aeriscardovia sp.]